MNVKEIPTTPAYSIGAVITVQVLSLLAVFGLFAFLYLSGYTKAANCLILVSAVLCVFIYPGYYILEPNQALVVSFFGNYTGTIRKTGMGWMWPWYTTNKLSVRVNNFESSRAKVNDKEGTPIEIAAIVVWRVKDTAAATYGVTDINAFIQLQAESAVRSLAMSYPYDSHTLLASPSTEEGNGTGDASPSDISLRGTPEVVAADLQKHIQDRVMEAGIEIIEARLSHLAYAPEIAQAMLQRQQAGAVIAARAKIVEGAVGIVQHALTALAKDDAIELDQERKAQMVSNLLVVLCSDRSVTPVVNAGSIHG